jgi:hypothetical protein
MGVGEDSNLLETQFAASLPGFDIEQQMES